MYDVSEGPRPPASNWVAAKSGLQSVAGTLWVPGQIYKDLNQFLIPSKHHVSLSNTRNPGRWKKSADMTAPAQFLYTTASPSPQQDIQQSFAAGAALGLQYQMSSESFDHHQSMWSIEKTKLHFVKCMQECMPSVRRAITKSSESMVRVG